jgi:hypothetical protein
MFDVLIKFPSAVPLCSVPVIPVVSSGIPKYFVCWRDERTVDRPSVRQQKVLYKVK